MAKEVLHVVPHDQGWAVKRAGVDRVDSTHGTQKDAIEAAREEAKERDDIVIHRPDGTIRERVTYMGPNGQSNDADDRGTRASRAADREDIHLRDVASVGSRVSWGAVLAGVMVALGLYVTFSALAVATGLSLADRANPDNFPIGAAIVAAVTLIAAMFLGGFVASRMTVGEQTGEAITYGVLVWGTVLLLLTIGGMSLGLNLLDSARRGDVTDAGSMMPAERMQQDLGLNQQQADRYNQMVNESRRDRGTAESIAWWTFGTMALSLLAAIGGGLAGAGPEFVLRAFRRESHPVAVAPRPA
jgi:hypothetical protein